MKKITYIDEVNIENKRILLRVDYNVSLNHDKSKIADDERISHSLPTIKMLLPKNKIILISHLDRPKTRDPKLSLKIVVNRLKEYLPKTKITLIDDFLTDNGDVFKKQQNGEILVLENIRFYPGEKTNDPKFTKKLADLGDVYVNDGFAVSHRADASIVGVAGLLPSYGGTSLKREIIMIGNAIKNPKRPLVTIIGGAKISTKINLINKLVELADHVLLAGGLANVFFRAQRFSIGSSICEYEMVLQARKLLFLASQKKTKIELPSDVIIGNPDDNKNGGHVVRIGEKIPKELSILDIGPETKARFGAIIARAKTVIWNGPVGLFENPSYKQGTDFIYYSIAHNPDAVSIVGGGDTLAAISKKEYLDKITHISTGGGAMLEFIEQGTLVGIEALKK